MPYAQDPNLFLKAVPTQSLYIPIYIYVYLSPSNTTINTLKYCSLCLHSIITRSVTPKRPNQLRVFRTQLFFLLGTKSLKDTSTALGTMPLKPGNYIAHLSLFPYSNRKGPPPSPTPSYLAACYRCNIAYGWHPPPQSIVSILCPRDKLHNLLIEYRIFILFL